MPSTIPIICAEGVIAPGYDESQYLFRLVSKGIEKAGLLIGYGQMKEVEFEQFRDLHLYFLIFCIWQAVAVFTNGWPGFASNSVILTLLVEYFVNY
jgi:hypothetical protein